MRNILYDKNAFATTLLLYIVDSLGSEALSYEPETIAEFMRERNPHIPQYLIDRANAAIGLLNSNLFWQDPVTFALICRTLNRKKSATAAEPSLEDIAWGMTEAALIMSPSEEDEKADEYSMAIKSYVNYLLLEAGIYDTPNCMKGIPAPSINSTIEDPQQLASIQQRSDKEKAELEVATNETMAELLLQISTAGINLSKEASEELTQLNKEMEPFNA